MSDLVPSPAWMFALTTSGNLSPLLCFGGYLFGVFLLAWWSARRRKEAKSFVSEYYLGGRQLGAWALALTFAATAASGGSFVGFPAYIYEHGWVLALWIAGYMTVPLVGMGLLGRRLNRVASQADAVTVPEVLGKRLGSPAAGGVATALIALFIFCYLIAQFKAGSKILASLLEGSSWFQWTARRLQDFLDDQPALAGLEGDYVLCLILFVVVVVAYVAYGGFRAVVWTDVMQGILMFAGVVTLLGLVLVQAGGLGSATRELGTLTPPDKGQVKLVLPVAATEARLVAKGAWISDGEGGLVRIAKPVLIPLGATESAPVEAVFLTSPAEMERVALSAESGVIAETITRRPYARGAGEAGVYLSAPGPHFQEPNGFLGLALAFSFFVFWPFGTAAQPSNMVRLMAFQEPRILWRALIAVALYFSVIYFGLVVIFCCGRVLMPGMAIDPDQTMPALAAQTTAVAGVPWLAGILLAAPFAAVMSSVDSFLLVASSSLVRDIYQQFIDPSASEKRVKRLSYYATIGIGAAAFVASLKPPDYLQEIIVFASGGLAASFLVPMSAVLFWKRVTAWGAIAGMLGGSLTYMVLHEGGQAFLRNRTGLDLTGWQKIGLDPFVWAQVGSALVLVLVSLCTRPPERATVKAYFG